MTDSSLEASGEIDIDSYGECLDDTIRGILRNADSYLNSTFFSTATSSDLGKYHLQYFPKIPEKLQKLKIFELDNF
jgi:hypothetical protein